MHTGFVLEEDSYYSPKHFKQQEIFCPNHRKNIAICSRNVGKCRDGLTILQDCLLRLHISKSKRTGKRTCTDLLDASFRKAGGPEKCGQELKKIYETLKTQINPVLCDAQTHTHNTSTTLQK